MRVFRFVSRRDLATEKKNTGPVDNHVETVLVLVLYFFNLNLIYSYEGKIT